MAHLNLYLPDDLADGLRQEAQKVGQPLSRYVLALLNQQRQTSQWPVGYFDRVCGFLSPDFEEPADLVADPVESMNL